MAEDGDQALLGALDSADWSVARDAVEHAGDVLRARPVDDELRAVLAAHLLRLSAHPNWQVRKAVAHAALFLRHDVFHSVIARLVDDDNAWVQEAARKTLQRREGLSRDDIHGHVQGDAIDGLLAALEARHGPRARRMALSVADRLHHRFVREAYHEIVRIISPLDASLLNLERELVGTPGITEQAVKHARRARDRVGLITEFLDNLRAFTTESPVGFTREALLPIVREAIDLVVSGIENAGNGIDVRLGIDDDVAVEGSRSALLQALINIIANAVEACDGMPRRGVLTIATTQHGDRHVKLTLSDNGCGMSEETLKDCVLLYSSGKPNGMGFGLPLAKKIIEIDHRGALSIESQLGVGTTLSIVLPIEQVSLEG